MEKRDLPCFPCPHKGACCNYGVELIGEEPAKIFYEHGPEAMIEIDGVIRTAIVNGACYFLKDGMCSIHNKPEYPAVCRGFPWTDHTGTGVYSENDEDLAICPELKPT